LAVVLSVFLDLHFLITPLVSSDDQAVYVVMNLHVSNVEKYVFMLVYMVELFDFWYSCAPVWLIDLIDFWCLTPLSAIFQLYHGDQF
jgi:hypothetical protein